MRRHVTATGIKLGLCCNIWDIHVCCTGLHQAMPSCVRALAQTRPCIKQHIKELPGVQSECVTMDISMAMTLSVDSPTLPRLQYLFE